MIVLGILGDIGSGKSFVSKQFKCPIFSADHEVNKIYRKNKICYKKLKNKLPKFIKTYPIDKIELTKAVLANKNNLEKIISVVHPLVRKKMLNFLKQNSKKKLVVLDIPLLLENKINKKNDILIFIDAKRKEINKRLEKRNNKTHKILKKFQLPVELKKRKSDFTIKNNFRNNSTKKNAKRILRKILFNA